MRNYKKEKTPDHNADSEKMSENKYHELVESISDVFFAMDKNLRCTYWNKASERLTGIPAEKAIGKTLMEVYPDNEAGKQAKEMFLLVIKTHHPQHLIVPYLGDEHTMHEIDSYPTGEGVSVFVRDVTEQKRLREELMQSQLILNDAERLAKIGSWSWDVVTGKVVWSDELYRINGRDPKLGAIAYAKQSSCYTKESWELLDQNVKNTLKTGKPYELELEFIRSDGSHIKCLVNGGAKKDDKGKIIRLYGTVRDITQQKEIEKKLAEREKFLNEAQTVAGIGVYKTDFTLDRWESSEVLDKIFGIDKDYVRSVEGWESLVHPDDRKIMTDYLQNDVFAKKQNFDKEYRIVQKNSGKERWVHGLGEMTFDKKNNPLTLVGTIQDITEQKKSEAKLKELSDRYLAVTNSAKDAMVTADSMGKIVDWNKAAEELFGYPEKEAKGNALSLIIPQELREKHKEGIDRVGRGGDKHILGKTVELEGLKKDGNKIPIELSLSEWEVSGEHYYTGVIRDITERSDQHKRLNDQISELNRFKDLTVGRELRMIELKKQIEELKGKKESTD